MHGLYQVYHECMHVNEGLYSDNIT